MAASIFSLTEIRESEHIAPFPFLPRTIIPTFQKPFKMPFTVITNTISVRDADATTNPHSGIKNVVPSSTLSNPKKISSEIQKADAIPDTMDTLSWLGYIDEDARWYSPAAQRAEAPKIVVAQQAVRRRRPPPSPSFSSIPRSAPSPVPVVIECAPEVKPVKVTRIKVTLSIPSSSRRAPSPVTVPEIKALKKIVSSVIRPFQFRERAR